MLLNVYLYKGVVMGNWHATSVELAMNAYSSDRDKAKDSLLRAIGGSDDKVVVGISDDYKEWLGACEVLQAWEEDFDGRGFDKILFRVIKT